jgi:hypothetical protein
LPLIARVMSDLARSSLVLLRLPSAVASALLVLLTGLLARELGGGRAAQVLAATAIAVAPLAIGSGHPAEYHDVRPAGVGSGELADRPHSAVRRRSALARGWRGAIAAVLWLPYLTWQASHGWPELAMDLCGWQPSSITT